MLIKLFLFEASLLADEITPAFQMFVHSDIWCSQESNSNCFALSDLRHEESHREDSLAAVSTNVGSF